MQRVGNPLTKLNMATRQWHADVDAPWLDLLRANVSRADYLTQLVRTYGFVGPFEAACMYTPRLGRVLDLRQLSRAGLIAQDLLTLGLSPAQVAVTPQCHAITPFKDVPEALGWLYVVERSTLLHDGIRKHLVDHLPDIDAACSYLAAFEGRVTDRWDAFGRTLEQTTTTPDRMNDLVAAAHAGFARVRDWFRSTSEARRAG